MFREGPPLHGRPPTVRGYVETGGREPVRVAVWALHPLLGDGQVGAEFVPPADHYRAMVRAGQAERVERLALHRLTEQVMLGLGDVQVELVMVGSLCQ